jgi:hypothetical protein
VLLEPVLLEPVLLEPVLLEPVLLEPVLLEPVLLRASETGCLPHRRELTARRELHPPLREASARLSQQRQMAFFQKAPSKECLGLPPREPGPHPPPSSPRRRFQVLRAPRHRSFS